MPSRAENKIINRILEKQDEFIQCRVFKHAWDDVTGQGVPLESQHRVRILTGKRFIFRCVRCGTHREDIWARVTGELQARHYYYPEGYETAKDERPTLKQVRLAYMKKFDPKMELVKAINTVVAVVSDRDK